MILNKRFWTDLWCLLLYMLVGLIALLPVFFLAMSLGQHRTAELTLLQWGQTLMMEIVPVICWYKWYKHEPVWQGLRMTPWPGWQCLLLGAALALAAVPLSDVLGVLNVWLCDNCLPESLRLSNEADRVKNAQMMADILNVQGVWGWISLILLMCIATGVAEEMVCRGALLRCLGIKAYDESTWHQYGRGSVLRVALLTGFIFSAIHMELDGLLPRWMLGALFLYIVYYTGSLWPAVVAHATNNLVALILAKTMPEDPTNTSIEPWEWGVLTAGLAAGLAVGYPLVKALRSGRYRVRPCDPEHQCP